MKSTGRRSALSALTIVPEIVTVLITVIGRKITISNRVRVLKIVLKVVLTVTRVSVIVRN